MEKRNKTTLIKKSPRCSICERKKQAQQHPPAFGFTANPARRRDISSLIDEDFGTANAAVAVPGSPASNVQQPSQQPSQQAASGSSALSTGAAAAGGTAVGSKILGKGTGAGLGSRLTGGLRGVGGFLGRAGLVGLPAVGTYMGAKAIEELIGSAFAASAAINPSIKGNLKELSLLEPRLVRLKGLVQRMTGMSSHIDNHSIKLGTSIGRTAHEVEKAKEVATRALAHKGVTSKSKHTERRNVK